MSRKTHFLNTGSEFVLMLTPDRPQANTWNRSNVPPPSSKTWMPDCCESWIRVSRTVGLAFSLTLRPASVWPNRSQFSTRPLAPS